MPAETGLAHKIEGTVCVGVDAGLALALAALGALGAHGAGAGGVGQGAGAGGCTSSVGAANLAWKNFIL